MRQFDAGPSWYHSLRHLFRRLRFRLTNGFWPEEWYSLDTALARWLSVRLAYLSQHTISVPQSYVDHHGVDAAFEEWRLDLALVSADLLRYGKHYEAETDEEEKERILGGEAAMLWVASCFKDLWD